MTGPQQITPLQRLRAHVAHLEEDNRRLRGQQVPSAAAMALQRDNAELHRQLAAATPRAAGAGAAELLTLPEVAQALGVSTYEVLRDLRESLPMGSDAAGQPVVARADLDAYLLARAAGRPTSRFL